MYNNNKKNEVLQGALSCEYTGSLLSYSWVSGLGAGSGCRRGWAESWG